MALPIPVSMITWIGTLISVANIGATGGEGIFGTIYEIVALLAMLFAGTYLISYVISFIRMMKIKKVTFFMFLPVLHIVITCIFMWGWSCFDTIRVMKDFSRNGMVEEEYSKTIETSYGDVFNVEYKEYNFPDSSSHTELTHVKTNRKVWFTDDPATEQTNLEECYSNDEYNVYFFHESFIFVNDHEMLKVPKKDLYENCDWYYTQYPALIKAIILDGDHGITCLYAEFYLKEKDKDVENRIYEIAEISEDEDPTRYNGISDFKFNRCRYSGHGCEEVIAFSKQMVEKYNISR